MIDRFFVLEIWLKHLAIPFLITLGTIFCFSQNSLGQTQINESLVDLKDLKITVQIDSELTKMGLTANLVILDAILGLPSIVSAESNNNLVIFVNAIEISDKYFFIFN